MKSRDLFSADTSTNAERNSLDELRSNPNPVVILRKRSPRLCLLAKHAIDQEREKISIFRPPRWSRVCLGPGTHKRTRQILPLESGCICGVCPVYPQPTVTPNLAPHSHFVRRLPMQRPHNASRTDNEQETRGPASPYFGIICAQVLSAQEFAKRPPDQNSLTALQSRI